MSNQLNDNPVIAGSQSLHAALGYLQRGFSIIPVRPKTKRPCIEWKEFQRRLPTREEVVDWWTRWPDAGIALVTGDVSGIVVLDEDVPNSLDGREMPLTPTSRTGGGGRHYFFSHPGSPVSNFAKRIPGVDFRGDGGYVLLPPSRHSSGRVYEWEMSLEDVPLSPMPRWLLDMVQHHNECRHSTGKHSGSSTPHDEKWWGAGSREASTRFNAAELLQRVHDPDIRRLVKSGPRPGEYPSRSEAAWHAICWLVEHGWKDEEVVALLLHAGHKLGARYRERGRRAEDRLLEEIARARRKSRRNWNVGFGSYEGDEHEQCTATDIPESGDLWVPVEGYKCGSTLSSFYSPADRRVLVIRLFCQRLDCPRCGPRWRKQLKDHLTMQVRIWKVSTEKQGLAPTLYKITVPLGRWKSLRDGLRRKIEKQKHGGYVTFRLDNSILVVATAVHKLRDGTVQAVPLTVDGAIDVISERVDSLRSKDDYSTSHGWAKRREAKGWIPLGHVQGDLSIAEELTDEFGFTTWTPRRVPDDDFDGFIGEWCEEVPPDAFAKLAADWWRWLVDRLQCKTLGDAA